LKHFSYPQLVNARGNRGYPRCCRLAFIIESFLNLFCSLLRPQHSASTISFLVLRVYAAQLLSNFRGNQIAKPGKAADTSTSQIQLGLRYGEAPINNWHYTPANQGYAPPSISAHYAVNQAYSTAPNYSSENRAYAGSTSLPTPQAAEQQPPPGQRQPHAYQRDQYGQPQQEYFTTTSGWPSRKYFLPRRFPQKQLTSFEEHQTSNAEPFPRQPESTTAGTYQ